MVTRGIRFLPLRLLVDFCLLLSSLALPVSVKYLPTQRAIVPAVIAGRSWKFIILRETAQRHANVRRDKDEGGNCNSCWNVKWSIVVWLSGDSGEVLVLMGGRGALGKRRLAKERKREGGIRIEETPLRDSLSLHCSGSLLNAQVSSKRLHRHNVVPR